METQQDQVLRVVGVNTPGLLTCVAQAFSSVNVAVDSLRLERCATDPTAAVISITFRADDRSASLITRRVSRLIDVVDVAAGDGDEPAIIIGAAA